MGYIVEGVELAADAEGYLLEPDYRDAVVEAIAAAEGITLEQLELPGMERTRFKPASRKLLLFAKDLKVSDVTPDDLNEGRWMVETSFTLPRGCFATIIARRLVLLPART